MAATPALVNKHLAFPAVAVIPAPVNRLPLQSHLAAATLALVNPLPSLLVAATRALARGNTSPQRSRRSLVVAPFALAPTKSNRWLPFLSLVHIPCV